MSVSQQRKACLEWLHRLFCSPFRFLCVHHSHALPNHAFAQSEEGQLPAAPAHHGLRRASAVQQHRGQSSGVRLQEEQDALQLGQLPPRRSSHAARHVPALASQ